MKKLLLIFLTLFPTFVFATDTLGTIADTIALNDMPVFLELIPAIAYICGIICGIKGALKLKEWNETKGQQVKLHIPLTYLFAAAVLIAFPSYVDLGKHTFFGSGAEAATQGRAGWNR